MSQPSKVLLGIIGNGRPDFLERTITSLEENLHYDFCAKVLIDDSGDWAYHRELRTKYEDRYTVICHPQNRGLSGSVRTLWDVARDLDVDYVWHQEDDFVFHIKPPVAAMKAILEAVPTIAQIALKRQPCNAEEAHVGGFMQQAPDTYWPEQASFRKPAPMYVMGSANPRSFGGSKWDHYDYVRHRNFFTLNPSLYPRWVVDLGWEQGWGEKEFGERLFANEEVTCAFLGTIDSDPSVGHIGNYRGNNWFV